MEPTIDMLMSPHDRTPDSGAAPSTPLVQLRCSPRLRWVPSRYNARAIGDDGRLILWNTFTGAISVFLARDREAVVAHLSATGVTTQDKYTRYLTKRGFLVRDSTDELARFRYRYARDQWRTDAMELILLASEDCNFR
ncbi:MAG TPA: hypothetical protein VHG51_04700, partial [Longimicrobiaceae bacterium]|nr:hypothetical protein [Longimicrobiaceae bacterium]